MVLLATAEFPPDPVAREASRRLLTKSRLGLSDPIVGRVDPPVLDFLVDCSGIVVILCWSSESCSGGNRGGLGCC